MLPAASTGQVIRPALMGNGTAFRAQQEIFPVRIIQLLLCPATIGVPVVMMVLSLLFCALQALVFTMLTSIYLDEATETE